MSLLFCRKSCFLAAALGNSLGSMSSKVEKKVNRAPMSNHPTHQAPNHRGSELSMVGVRPGAMYILRNMETRAYPTVGPIVLMKNVKPGISQNIAFKMMDGIQMVLPVYNQLNWNPHFSISGSLASWIRWIQGSAIIDETVLRTYLIWFIEPLT